jgi:hypothetical protein
VLLQDTSVSPQPGHGRLLVLGATERMLTDVQGPCIWCMTILLSAHKNSSTAWVFGAR